MEILRLSFLDGYSKCIAMCSSWSIASMRGCFQLFPLYLLCVVYCTVHIYILHIYGHVVVFCRPKQGAYSIKRPNIYQTWTFRFDDDEPRRRRRCMALKIATGSKELRSKAMTLSTGGGFQYFFIFTLIPKTMIQFEEHIFSDGLK